MPISSSTLHSIFSFRTGSTTVFASLFYLFIFTSLYVTQNGPSVPPSQTQHALGLNLEHAYRDLHTITERPHPYNSRENDIVRNFLLERVRGIAKGHDFIHVDDDVHTNAAFVGSVSVNGSKVVYFQGNNILVKVDGTEEGTKDDAVLFSAHFDSVSTAPGATDDGMSIVALVQMIEFLSKNRPRRTAVFNLNNGEEDQLHGSQAFLRHPWSNLTSTFLNFEGAGAGGRPFLFRSTSYDIIKAFCAAPHIHADAISQDAWNRGVIRSDTDYSVYSAPRARDVSRDVAGNDTTASAIAHGYQGPGGGMQGADIAFYSSRSRYHTMEDTIRGMGDEGARRSLWALLELLRHVGDHILNIKTESSQSDRTESPVYFELFGVHLVAFRLRVMVVAEIVLLSVGPVLLASLGYYLFQQSAISATSPSPTRWRSNFRGYGRFWLTCTLGAGAQTGLVVSVLKLNPNTAHSHQVAISLSAFALAYLSLAIPLKVAQRVRPIPPSQHRFVILVELYALTWFLLVGATILARRINMLGLYWIALWNASLLVAVVLAILEGLSDNSKPCKVVPPPEESEGEQVAEPGEQQESEDSETTPLLRQHAPLNSPPALEERTEDRTYLWWIFQFIFSMTAPVLSLGNIYCIWIGAMPQTIPDGGWVGVVYAPISLLAFLILLPLAPFVLKVHRFLTIFILIIFIASTTFVWIAPPFSPNARLKVGFAHEVELTNVTGAISRPKLTRAATQLTAIDGYGPRLVATLPSSWDSVDKEGIQCKAGKLRSGLTTCEWPVPRAMQPSIPSAKKNEDTWIIANITRLGSASLRVEIEGVQTRACRIYIDSHEIRRYRTRTLPAGNANDSEGGESKVSSSWTRFEIPTEVKEVHLLRLWARTWGSKFEVELDVDADTEDEDDGGGLLQEIAGRLSCLWNDGPGGARIPALEEARGFLPEWVGISKAADGLVEAISGFVLRAEE